MKSVIILCVLTLVGLTVAKAPPLYSRGCLYVMGKCVKECEVGTHAYNTGCGVLTPEATCENPNPQPDTKGLICDYSSCYCDSPTVRDTVSGKCVELEDCPK